MSDVITKYKGWLILRNYLGFRISHLEHSPIFKKHNEAKKYIRKYLI